MSKVILACVLFILVSCSPLAWMETEKIAEELIDAEFSCDQHKGV